MANQDDKIDWSAFLQAHNSQQPSTTGTGSTNSTANNLITTCNESAESAGLLGIEKFSKDEARKKKIK